MSDLDFQLTGYSPWYEIKASVKSNITGKLSIALSADYETVEVDIKLEMLNDLIDGLVKIRDSGLIT
jgi:hypothetical protein